MTAAYIVISFSAFDIVFSWYCFFLRRCFCYSFSMCWPCSFFIPTQLIRRKFKQNVCAFFSHCVPRLRNSLAYQKWKRYISPLYHTFCVSVWVAFVLILFAKLISFSFSFIFSHAISRGCNLTFNVYQFSFEKHIQLWIYKKKHTHTTSDYKYHMRHIHKANNIWIHKICCVCWFNFFLAAIVSYRLEIRNFTIFRCKIEQERGDQSIKRNKMPEIWPTHYKRSVVLLIRRQMRTMKCETATQCVSINATSIY